MIWVMKEDVGEKEPRSQGGGTIALFPRLREHEANGRRRKVSSTRKKENVKVLE